MNSRIVLYDWNRLIWFRVGGQLLTHAKKEKKENDEYICDECGATLIRDPQRGHFVCPNCGYVGADIIDLGPDWRAYDSQEREQRERSGSPINPNLPYSGIRSHIGVSSKDSQGNPIRPDKRGKYRKWQQLDNATEQAKERNLRDAMTYIHRMVQFLNLPESAENLAAEIYRKALSQNLIQGRSIEMIAYASVFLAAYQLQLGYTLRDFLKIYQEDKSISKNVQMRKEKELRKAIRTLLENLDMNQLRRFSREDRLRFLIQLVHRIGEKLGLSMQTRIEAAKITEIALNHGLTIGRNPRSIAAAAIYLAGMKTGERKTQQEIANEAGTTPVTIRGRFKELAKYVDIE